MANPVSSGRMRKKVHATYSHLPQKLLLSPSSLSLTSSAAAASVCQFIFHFSNIQQICSPFNIVRACAAHDSNFSLRESNYNYCPPRRGSQQQEEEILPGTSVSVWDRRSCVWLPHLFHYNLSIDSFILCSAIIEPFASLSHNFQLKVTTPFVPYKSSSPTDQVPRHSHTADDLLLCNERACHHISSPLASCHLCVAELRFASSANHNIPQCQWKSMAHYCIMSRDR